MKNVSQFLSGTLVMLMLCSFVNSPVLTSAEPLKAAGKYPAMGGIYLLFADKMGGEIAKKQIESQSELRVDGCVKGSHISSFTLEVKRSGKITSFASESNALTAEMMASLKSLQPGDEFEFKNTRACLGNTKEIVDVHSRKFVVV
jgi:hypothetical protein